MTTRDILFREVRGSTSKILLVLLCFLIPTQLTKFFWPSWSFVKGARVDYLAPVIYSTDILILFYLTTALYKNKKSTINLLSNHKKTLLALLVFATLNTAIAFLWQVALFQWLKVIVLTMLAVIIKGETKKTKTKCLNAIVISSIYVNLIAIVQFVKNSSIGGYLYWFGERRFNSSTIGIAINQFTQSVQLRPYATFPHPNILAAYNGIIIFILITKIKNSTTKYLLICFSLLTIVLTSSVNAIAAFLASYLFYLLIKGGKKRYANVVVRVILSCIIISLASLLIDSNTLVRFKSFSITSRISLLNTAKNVLQDNHFVGVGLGNFIPQAFNIGLALNSTLLQPVHNLYILIFAETGIIGLALVYLLVYKSIFKNDLFKDLEDLHLLVLVFIAVSGLLDHYWLTSNQLKLLITVILAI